jgi:deazaflavin-dependent oxidoreductase (nitroreductase family)
MDEVIRRALSRGQVIDITTIGRRTRQPRRIEIVFHAFGNHLYISGLPSRRTRAWIHNLRADPTFTVHLKGPDATADLPATARIITDEAERRRILEQVARVWRRTDVDVMVRFAPLIEVTITGYTDATAA